jgi:hypothetical protein
VVAGTRGAAVSAVTDAQEPMMFLAKRKGT